MGERPSPHPEGQAFDPEQVSAAATGPERGRRDRSELLSDVSWQREVGRRILAVLARRTETPRA